MTSSVQGFLGAVQFLTRIPVRTRVAPDLAAAVMWFPVVGYRFDVRNCAICDFFKAKREERPQAAAGGERM